MEPVQQQSFYDAVGGAETFQTIPRLRMRHVPFRIGPAQRDAWLRCMQTAVGEVGSDTLGDEHRRELLDYLQMAAQSLVNAPF